ncbi:hypothetical protein A3J43_04230 [Candidatus Uhrbacteria bacterium RIFCSPHIGHO2_12_FULL_54_23]|uniref:Glycerophosphoryl diester phosphodiesterase membrane domain-containing protein n=3 Tax=Candidatus Uhriibacteriota TaxID=1752732 RepID=A0A1F7UFI8_9BACT|nr:MAG: hypothetical protein UY79_C0006G0009 [Parcubacteria group bacterium GW2011_GWA2_53_21]OGL77035.1 MAG: hypothetical protein A3J43_04230 [Candidatus Uhrbacteria bacterium RIFCSPHIGHO2_12_FULL_54_23]OGL85574.1 MAG: hypothetical protein A3B36_00415 [Candidatus Uhrbacteria bacterium RIFCSPLOWO2_01_FULL_55_36]OGL89578.1 MAG: hypothetical protein A3J36_02795 [Candidatus Uhrbacteria bacterium RIFCSPLOWO2_02_FULL_54_37]
MSSVYRPLLRRAWSITWQEKHLWVFGLFTAVIVSGGELNMLVRNLNRLQSLGTWADTVRAEGFSFVPRSLAALAGWPAGWYAALAALIALVLFLLWFAVVAEGALVGGIERARRRADMSLAEGIAHGKKLWGKVAVITAGFHLGAHLAWALFALPPFLLFLAFGSSLWFTAFLIVAFLCLIPAGLAIALLFRLSLAAVVVEQQTLRAAWGCAWELFRAHWLVLLETVILLTAGTTLAAIVALAAAAVGLALIFGPLLLLSFVTGAPAVLSIVVGLALVLFLFALLWVGAVLATFQQAVWVLLFVRMRESPPLAKLVRFFALRARR